MKKILLSLVGASLGVLATAQITVSHDHIATLGDTVFMSEDTLNGVNLNLENAAGNQVWDFTSLTEHKPDGAILEDPTTAPLSSNFPDADFVINDLVEDSMHLFFKQTDDYLDVIGLVEYDSTGSPTVPFTNLSWRFMEFPADYQDEWVSSGLAQVQINYVGIDPDSLGPHPTIDSLRSKLYYGFENEIDAWGELQLPAGNWLSLRQKMVDMAEIKVDWFGNGAWRPISESFFLSLFMDSVMTDTGDITYRWWGDNAGATFFLAEVETDSLGNPDSNVTFMKGAPVPPLSVRTAEDVVIDVFPNPCSDVLTINVDGAESFSIEILDVNMRTVLNEQVIGSRLRMDMSSVPSGAYLLQIKDNSDHLIELKKVQVIH